MSIRIQSFACALVVTAGVTSVALAQTETKPAPDAKGTTYDVAFTFGDTTYSGTMKLTFAKDTISGTMTIDSPVPVTGTVAGKRDGTKLTFDYPYSMGGDQPCSGRVTIEAKMDQKSDSASGTAHSVGCSDQPLDGTFSLKRPPDRQ